MCRTPLSFRSARLRKVERRRRETRPLSVLFRISWPKTQNKSGGQAPEKKLANKHKFLLIERMATALRMERQAGAKVAWCRVRVPAAVARAHHVNKPAW